MTGAVSHLAVHREVAAVDVEFANAIGIDAQLRRSPAACARAVLSKGSGRRLSMPARLLASDICQASLPAPALRRPLQASWPLTRLATSALA